jgi:hypothetical protein
MTEPTATEFTPTFTWFANQGAYYTKDATQTTSTAVFYEIKTRDSSGNDTTPAWIVGQYGIEFRLENGNTVLYCNTGNNNDIPYTFANSAVTQTLTNNNIGDTITAYQANGSIAYTFTVVSGMLWTAGLNTLSNSGSLEKVGANLVWTISSVSQDGDYTISESSDGGSSWSVKTTIVIPNLAGTRTGNVLNWDESYIYKFYDPLENEIGSYGLRRKVHRNFW